MKSFILTITEIAELKEQHIKLVKSQQYEEAAKYKDQIKMKEDGINKELDINISKVDEIIRAADAFINSVLDTKDFPGIDKMIDLRKDLKEIKLTINGGKS